ncbi:DUF11 domain-containing protein [Phytoactinopolyspora alkaliphila]|uniref:DUF11 domain-containing protein n=1 Tax=Phytoactinopolyspora alkaliphila TaxID=1783498 RepID=A0A6N9YLV0_9ACTN|nr:DUF11 domain-containing protein [Phytoactinopolyspora alkaliphila]NED96051.1 DUF11 domain-containing protein [Phytoactinopolyspora alkaliphila]
MSGSLLAGTPALGAQAVDTEGSVLATSDERPEAAESETPEPQVGSSEEDASEEDVSKEDTSEEEVSEEETSEESAPDETPLKEESNGELAKDEDTDVNEPVDEADEPSAASGLAPMSVAPANTRIGSMTFYAYVGPGESLDVLFARVGGPASVGTVTVDGPGAGPFVCTIPGTGVPPPCTRQNLTGDPGVWRIQLAAGTANTQFDWRIDVRDGASTLDGRVWTENYNMRQASGDPLAEFSFWYQTEHGYLYEATYAGYNGINSIFRADGTGVRYNDTCTSAYASIVYANQQGEVPDPDRSVTGLGECGDPYKIFFEHPAADLPASSIRWDGTTDWVVPPIVAPTITELTFTPDNPATRAGVISYEVENFTGQLVVEIDTDNDGTFDLAIPGSAVDGSGNVYFDGLAGNGNAISISQDMPVRVSITQVGEIHFANTDVEVRSGGLEVIRLNGPGAGDATLYWNDTDLSTTHPCGTWTSTLDGRGGIGSSGGVHWWNVNGCPNIVGGWGDARIIDDWTYVPVDISMEIVVLAEVPEPPVQCPAGSTLVPVSIIQNPSYEDRSGDFQNSSSASTIGYAEHWYDSHPTGGQYHVFSPTFDSGPPAATMPVRSGAHGYGFMGGHSTGGVGEGATNTLAEPLVPGAIYVGYFSMAAGGYSRQGNGYMEFFGTSDREMGHIPHAAVNPPTVANTESLYQTPVVNYPGAGVTPPWEQHTFTLVPTEAWDFLRVEVRNANPANDGTVAGQTWINFDDFHMFLCAAPVIEKTSDATEDSRPGDTVTYTVTATNPTSVDLPSVTVADDLSGVLDDATLDESSLSANPSTGTLGFTDPMIRWEGPLGSGESVTITYEVTLTGDGDGLVRNVAFAPQCDPLDPDCEETTPQCDPPDENGRDPQTGIPCAETEFELPRLVIEKVADKTELPAVGETVTYTVVAENVGPGDYTANAPAVVTDDLTDVLDDATLDESSLSSNPAGTLEYSEPVITWEGVLASGESVTITYTVTYTGEGDFVLLNNACVPEEQVAPSAEPCDSVRIPAAFIEDAKSVEASDDPVVAGTVLTYTLTFENTGEAAGTVDRVDDLTHVLDDGDVTSGPTVSDAALTATGPNAGNRISITGTLQPGQVVTVTYEVTVKPDGERGDNVAANFLLEPGADPLCDPADEDCDPPPCEPVEGELPDCTVTPIGEIQDQKSVEASADPVLAGTVLTYTLTFENTGEAPAPVDKVDDLTHVLDDGDVTSGPTVSDAALTATGPDAANRISVTGLLNPGDVVTVTYEVTLRADGERGDNIAANFLLDPDTDPLCDPADEDCDPPVCEPAEGELPDCTWTPIGEIDSSKAVESSDDPAKAGTVLTYTLTFENIGEAPAPVDDVDDLTHVLDDGDVTAGPTVSDAALSVAGPDADNRFHVTGTLNPGDVVTVTYEVTLRADGERGDNRALNFLLDPDTDPLCDPAEEDCEPPECADGDERCTNTPIGELEDWKQVDPASNTPVTAGQQLTYTLTFTNVGEADVAVDRVDELNHILDDADLISGPVTSDPALTASGPDGGNRISITGTLAPGQTVTVTYTVEVRETDERGDDLLANFLINPDQEICEPADPDCDPAELCEPAEGELADCTVNPIGDIRPSKSVDPASGTTVVAGEELTYTLTFENTGKGAARIDYIDHMAGVLDDAELVAGPTSSDAAVTTTGPDGDGRITITGTVGAGDTVTVTYTVKVRPDGERADNILGNFVVEEGVEPPEECLETNPLCTANPVPELVDWKSVDPASGTPVTGGTELTYTLTFTNVGEAPGEVDRVDDLTHVVDDAELIDGPTVSDDALTATGPDGENRIRITGTLAAGDTVTVTYTVKVMSGDERGDDVLANFLLDPEEPTPAPEDCEPADDERPDCTRNPIGNIAAEKSVDPESGTEVGPGDELTYTLTFTNTGEGADEVDYVDHAAGITDDAVLVEGPAASDDALSVSGPDGDQRFHITGVLGAGETATVTYTVRVKGYDKQGDGVLENFLAPTGEEPPASCVDTNPLCTENPIEEPPGEEPPGEEPPGEEPPDEKPPNDEPPRKPELPDTGSGIPAWALLIGLALLAGGFMLSSATGRRKETAGERSVNLDDLL